MPPLPFMFPLQKLCSSHSQNAYLIRIKKNKMHERFFPCHLFLFLTKICNRVKQIDLSDMHCITSVHVCALFKWWIAVLLHLHTKTLAERGKKRFVQRSYAIHSMCGEWLNVIRMVSLALQTHFQFDLSYYYFFHFVDCQAIRCVVYEACLSQHFEKK